MSAKLTQDGIDLSESLVDMDDLRNQAHLTVIAETDDRVVFVDTKLHELYSWSQELDVAVHGLSEQMHSLAREVTDYKWDVSDPLVIAKND